MLKGTLKFILMMGMLTVGLMGCSSDSGSDRYGIDPQQQMMASPQIEDSFSVQGDNLKISKGALEKEFLLQGQVIQSKSESQFQGLKSRVVYFSKKGSKVFMLESPVGHVVNNDFKVQLPLANFNILQEDDSNITLNLNEGLSRLYTANDWYAQDSNGGSYDAGEASARVSMSYIDQLDLKANNSVVIRQVVQIQGTGGVEQSVNAEALYYLTPYAPDVTFVPKNNYSFERYGFFEVNPIRKLGGEELVRASKFHSAKPIVFAISSNTPAEYREAVRAGILYWNQILGDRIQAVDAPAGVTAPNYDYNVIQWVNWDEAGFAYADAQMDPRSGEILHAQVYMTSVFAVSSRDGARAILRKLKAKKSQPAANVKLKGFEKSVLCDTFNAASAIDFLETVIASDMDDAAIKQVAQDYVTNTIAHEVGHTLGLRHNFAGSLAANYSVEKIPEFFKAYAETRQTPEGIISSSSVMDYQSFMERAFTGNAIRNRKAPLDYDVKAISHLYDGKEYKISELPLFCTDTQVGMYIDCQRGDSGNSVLELIKVKVKENIDHISQDILESAIYWKLELQEKGVDLLSIFPKPSLLGSSVVGNQNALRGLVGKDIQFLSIHRKHAYVGDINEEELLKEQDQYIASEIERLGGLSAVLNKLPAKKEEFVASLNESLKESLASGRYTQGVAYKNKEFRLSEAELALIQAKCQDIFSKLYDEVYKSQLTIWQSFLSSEKVRDTKVATVIFDFLQKELVQILFAVDSNESHAIRGRLKHEKVQEEIKKLQAQPSLSNFQKAFTLVSQASVGKEDYAKDDKNLVDLVVVLPKFTYSFEVRLAASKLLSIRDPENIIFGIREKYELRQRYTKFVESVFETLKNYEYKMEYQNVAVSRWLKEDSQIKGSLY